MSLKSKQAITAERQVPTIVNFKDYYDYVDNEILGGQVQLLPGCYRFFSGNNLIGNLVTSLNMININDTGTYFNNIIISVPDFGQFYKFKFFVYNKPGYELYNNRFYFRFREEVYTRSSDITVDIGIRETNTVGIYINPGETLVVEGYWTPSASETSAKLTLFYYPRYDYESKIITIEPITYTFQNLQTLQTSIDNIQVTPDVPETSEDQNESGEDTSSEELTHEATQSPEETSVEETPDMTSPEETSEDEILTSAE